MRTILTVAAALLAVQALAAGATTRAAPQESRQALVTQLEEALGAARWSDEHWSILVMSLDGGDTLFSNRPEASAVPASNLKLFTTAAGLHYLGPDYRYSTYLTGTGPVRGGVLEGDLYVYGTGDPTLSGRFHEGRLAVWEALADSLAALGVERISGDLVGDASYFEGSGIGRGWQASYITHTYAAPSSALSFNDNVVTLRVTPGPEVGGPPNVQFIPGGRVELQMEATTTSSGRSWVRLERAGYDAPLVMRGEVRKGTAAHWRAVPVRNPAIFTASVLEEVLRKRGIRVDGVVRSVHDAAASPVTGQKVFAPASDEDDLVQVLAVHRSPPLRDILEVINQRSHNQYADAVLRTVGRVATGRGTVASGEAAVKALLAEVGESGASVRMDDGSGLSPLNRASARSIVELLAFMAESPHASVYMETLPEAATSRGLRRMHQTPAAGNLKAKTGTIDRVSALSGYVRADNGELLAFSIMSNDVPSTFTAKRVEDRIGARLAAFSRSPPASRATRAIAQGSGSDTASTGAEVAAAGSSAASADSAPAPGEAPTTTASAESATGDDSEAGAPSTYVIRSGDTLEGIARSNGTSVEALREANPGVNARRLMPGQSLNIPVSGGAL